MDRSTILVATDGSAAAVEATKLASELARASGDELVFVTAWRELRGDFGLPLHRLIPDLVEAEREWAEQTLAAAAADARATGLEARTVCRHGPPAEEICELARELRPRLLVLGSTGWGSIEGAVFGSVSAHVLHETQSPVLLVPAPSLRKSTPAMAAAARLV